MREALNQAIRRAAEALRGQRNSAGYWEGHLASSPLGTAVALVSLAKFPAAKISRDAAWTYLLHTQNPDGGWGDTDRSKSNLAATLLALSAHACAPSPHVPAEAIQKAEHYVENLGGLLAGLRRVYGSDLTFQTPIRMAAAFAGLMKWRDVDALPFELALAPRGIMGALGLPVVSYALPALVCVGLARQKQAVHWFVPWWLVRAACASSALSVVRQMQPESGGYLEAIPITAFCLIGLQAAGRADDSIAANALKFLEHTQRADGSWPVEVNLSVWNTTRALDALHAGGLLEEEYSPQEREGTRDWLLKQQVKSRNVYSNAAAGGWGWNHLSGSVPDADDTAGAMIALRLLDLPREHPALELGKRWLNSLQNSDGGWPTFCRGWQKLPFDRSAADLTAHAMRAFFALGGETKTGLEYMRRNQRADGSFAPLWFGCEDAPDQLNATYATAQAILATGALAGAGKTICDKAVSFLRSIQNSDGGFGGCIGAKSTAEETGLALRALSSVAEKTDPELERTAQWLVERQRADGSWDPAPIGFYFAVLWYYEEMYPLCYALGGLGAYRKLCCR